MAIRIHEPKLDNTNDLLAQILVPILQDNERVLFLCPAGEGEKILQRLRVALSRQRKAFRQKGRNYRRFSLQSSIHKETHGGKRFDAVVCWQRVNVSDMLAQQLNGVFDV